eukprot:g31484.t1
MTTLANELLVKPFCALPRPGALGPAPGVEMQQTLREMISVTPLAPKRVMGNTEFLGFFFTWMILLGPVPMMRVVLRDHTVQCPSSEPSMHCCGFASRTLAEELSFQTVYDTAAWLMFHVRICMINRYKNKVGQKFCFGMLQHNYAPVAMRVFVRCPRLADPSSR